ncbi:hypothetical protein NPIL_679001 [Nephila pilipes]|uniref:Uncharacterized protein n=1 Tax=Nephila pilipes TaxID=299642 RepID=A0A8X6UAK7_NEPPI|nr:hypothetical protein NPIL_679001 [Nephila pilipes]
MDVLPRSIRYPPQYGSVAVSEENFVLSCLAALKESELTTDGDLPDIETENWIAENVSDPFLDVHYYLGNSCSIEREGCLSVRPAKNSNIIKSPC